MPSSQPVTFEHFEIARRPDGSLHELGRGAMGVTYKAFDTRLGSHVALKVINADAIKTDVGRARFEREARAAAHLNHPNVAAIFHRGQDGDAYFYAMQFIEGETFDAFVRRRGPLPAALALRLILQAAQGLSAASTRGLIHRDIKPANLMLVHADAAPDQPAGDLDADDDDLLVKVIDFGLAKYLNKSSGDTSDASLTGDRIVGTPYYMSPEQIDPQGREIDARADIYSLGVTLWHLLCGNPPFRGTEFQVLNQHMHNSLPWEQLPATVPAPVHDLLERMMAKNPADRPANHRELIGLLKQQLRSLGSGSLLDAGSAPLAAAGPGAPMPLQDVVERSSGDELQTPPDFSLLDVLQHRGNLTTSEVLGLLSLLAPVVDAKREQEAQAYDLKPARVFIRFDVPPTDPASLPAQRLDTWPPSQLEIAPLSVPVDDHPARRIGELAYELLAGHSMAEPYQPVPSVNARGNALLRQVLAAEDAFGSAGKFADAFRLALAGELHVPELPPPTVGGGAAADTRTFAPEEFPRTRLRPERSGVPSGIGTLLVSLGVLGAGWWWVSNHGKLPSAGSPGIVNDAFQSAPIPNPSATVSSLGADAPAAGSITSTAVRRYAPPPFFPPAAKAARQQGKVVLDVAVDAAGNVTGATVKQGSGFPLLDDSAVQTMRAWKFDPARTNGAAVASHTEQSIEFHPPPSLPGAPVEAKGNTP